jgi:proteic killer suppression protein
MIASFGSLATKDLYHGRPTAAARRLPSTILRAAFKKLDMVNAATSLDDLRSPPSNRLEALKGDLAGACSIRINRQ